MKIIENNYKGLNTNEQAYPIRYTCPYCDSVFEYENVEIFCDGFKHGLLYSRENKYSV